MFSSDLSCHRLFPCCESQSHCLPGMPSNSELVWSLDLLWGRLRLWSGPTFACSCLWCLNLPMLMHFFCRTSHCPFNLQLLPLVGRLCVLFLSPPAPGFSHGFTFTSACESSPRVCSWGCPGALGSAPRKFWCGGVTAAWVPGALVVSGIRGASS